MDDVGDLPGREVGDAQGADLAFGRELGHGAQGVVQRRGTVRLVQVEQVDAVHAEPAQAALDAVAQPFGGQRRVLAVVRVRHAGLGGEDDLIPAPLEEPGQHFLGGAAHVGVGGVDGGDAGVERLVHHAAGGGLVGGVAERHGAQDQPGDG